MTPKILDMYQKEYERKEQKEADKLDYEAWLNGLYIKDAIGVFVNKNNAYPEKPYRELEKDEEFEKENPTKAAAMNFANYAMAYNKSMNER